MTEPTQNTFLPKVAIHPGEIVEEYIAFMGMAQSELAQRTDLVPKHINEIIQGKAAVTVETAMKFEPVLGRPAHFWLNLQLNFDETRARLAEQEQRDADLAWLKDVPVKGMVRNGWISPCKDKMAQLVEVLKFFGVASPAAWREVWESRQASVAYRRSPHFTAHALVISAWLRQGEREGQGLVCQPYDKVRFLEALRQARLLTREPLFMEQLPALCASAGVAVVFVQELPGAGLSGATRWLTPRKALVQLSLRYKSDDQLWFTFFHEAGHILLHGKKDVFIENTEGGDREKEAEADRFAQDWLIPAKSWRGLVKENLTLEVVTAFADKLGIAPGIVVGRLQHERVVLFSWGNELKQRRDSGT